MALSNNTAEDVSRITLGSVETQMMELFYENDDTEEFDVDTIKLNQIRSGRLK